MLEGLNVCLNPLLNEYISQVVEESKITRTDIKLGFDTNSLLAKSMADFYLCDKERLKKTKKAIKLLIAKYYKDGKKEPVTLEIAINKEVKVIAELTKASIDSRLVWDNKDAKRVVLLSHYSDCLAGVITNKENAIQNLERTGIPTFNFDDSLFVSTKKYIARRRKIRKMYFK